MTAARSPHWLLFGGLAAAVVALDQLSKAWITSVIAPGEVIRLIGDELRLIITYNTGGIFGLFRDQAAIFAAFSMKTKIAYRRFRQLLRGSGSGHIVFNERAIGVFQ